MSNTVYPGSIDSPYNPTTLDTLATANHHTIEGLQNDAIVQLETKLGIGASTIPGANYILASSGAGASAWVNSITRFKLTTPQITTGLLDTNGNNILSLSPAASAVNYLQIGNAATGNSVFINAQGSDANVSIITTPKGSGNWQVAGRADGWNSLANFGSFTYSANNGNKEFIVNTPVNMTSFLSPGMRFSVTRGTVPPTQAMSFSSASSQYATKVSPSGITFTSAFTCEAWVYLLSYTGQNQYIISRTDTTTGGFQFYINPNGQVLIAYGASSSFTSFQTSQSIPLNRWVHIAGVITSVASKTGSIYINGLPAVTTSPATAATTLTQTSNLSVGGAGAGVANTFLNGYIAEARIWSAAQSQANILANMTINLTGSETNLVALYQGPNFNDLTSNANNLTATNGATQVTAYPYNATEYGIITKVSSTQLTIFTGTDYTIPNQTLTLPNYATVKSPAGWPTSKYKWMVDYKFKVQVTQVVTSTSVWLNHAGLNFSVPTGDFEAVCSFFTQITATSVAFLGSKFTLSTANNTLSSDDLTGLGPYSGNAAAERDGEIVIQGPISNTAMTTLYLNDQPNAVSGTTTMYINGMTQACEFRFFSSYV